MDTIAKCYVKRKVDKAAREAGILPADIKAVDKIIMDHNGFVDNDLIGKLFQRLAKCTDRDTALIISMMAGVEGE
jgi:hypothetical protein